MIQHPTQNHISQGKHGTYNAVDYSARKFKYLPLPKRSEIYAVEDGTITSYGVSGTCGNRLELTSSDGKRRWGECHLELAYVKKGQKVVRGQLIGKMGYSGYTIPKGEGGRHLHLVCLSGGKYVYPPTLVNAPFRSYPLGYPKTVTTTVNLNVRVKPTSKSTSVGIIKKGTKLEVINSVKGESVNGQSLWYVTTKSQYIWSGGVK